MLNPNVFIFLFSVFVSFPENDGEATNESKEGTEKELETECYNNTFINQETIRYLTCQDDT